MLFYIFLLFQTLVDQSDLEKKKGMHTTLYPENKWTETSVLTSEFKVVRVVIKILTFSESFLH